LAVSDGSKEITYAASSHFLFLFLLYAWGNKNTPISMEKLDLVKPRFTSPASGSL
jgi:hypothetical protein